MDGEAEGLRWEAVKRKSRCPVYAEVEWEAVGRISSGTVTVFAALERCFKSWFHSAKPGAWVHLTSHQHTYTPTHHARKTVVKRSLHFLSLFVLQFGQVALHKRTNLGEKRAKNFLAYCRAERRCGFFAGLVLPSIEPVCVWLCECVL